MNFHPLAIVGIRREGGGAVSLEFAVPEALRPLFRFRPGQHLTLRTTIDGVEVRRAYSICAGLDDGALRVAIKHVRDRVFSGYANTLLAVGDTLEVMAPQGRFGLFPVRRGCIWGLRRGRGSRRSCRF